NDGRALPASRSCSPGLPFRWTYMPIPLTVVALKVGDKLIMVDSGSGVGQWQPTAINLPSNMKAAGIDLAKISTILVSHFHPDREAVATGEKRMRPRWLARE